MTAISGDTRVILASKIKGTDVYDAQGEKIGQVEDLLLDKHSDRIVFAALAFGGALGLGGKYCAVPWSMLGYDEEKPGYIVPLSKEQLARTSASSLEDLLQNDAIFGTSESSYAYYYMESDQ